VLLAKLQVYLLLLSRVKLKVPTVIALPPVGVKVRENVPTSLEFELLEPPFVRMTLCSAQLVAVASLVHERCTPALTLEIPLPEDPNEPVPDVLVVEFDDKVMVVLPLVFAAVKPSVPPMFT